MVWKIWKNLQSPVRAEATTLAHPHEEPKKSLERSPTRSQEQHTPTRPTPSAKRGPPTPQQSPPPQVPSQDELRGTPNQPKKQGKRPKEKTPPRNAPSPEPHTNDITAHPFYQAQPEPPSPPLPTPAQHQNQPARPPVLTPWTTHRNPNPEPHQHPKTETPNETQPQRGLSHLIDTYTQQQPQSIRQQDWHQGNATEPQGPGSDPGLNSQVEQTLIPKPAHWKSMSKTQQRNWLKHKPQ